MIIQDIYEQYKIMPSLQLHMYRVAAVAKILSEHTHRKTDQTAIITACLLHDMGNILKFDLKMFPEFLEPQGLSYWKKVQDEYKQKYGTNEHTATIMIAKELAVSPKIIEYVDAISFEKAEDNYRSHDVSKMICQYSDMRVAPYGVNSLQDRVEDGRRRFKLRTKATGDDDLYVRMVTAIQGMEQYIFSKVKLRPEEITNELVNHELEELKEFTIQ